MSGLSCIEPDLFYRNLKNLIDKECKDQSPRPEGRGLKG
jgi:hypothetical protein